MAHLLYIWAFNLGERFFPFLMTGAIGGIIYLNFSKTFQKQVALFLLKKIPSPSKPPEPDWYLAKLDQEIKMEQKRINGEDY